MGMPAAGWWDTKGCVPSSCSPSIPCLLDRVSSLLHKAEASALLYVLPSCWLCAFVHLWLAGFSSIRLWSPRS